MFTLPFRRRSSTSNNSDGLVVIIPDYPQNVKDQLQSNISSEASSSSKIPPVERYGIVIPFAISGGRIFILLKDEENESEDKELTFLEKIELDLVNSNLDIGLGLYSRFKDATINALNRHFIDPYITKYQEQRQLQDEVGLDINSISFPVEILIPTVTVGSNVFINVSMISWSDERNQLSSLIPSLCLTSFFKDQNLFWVPLDCITSGTFLNKKIHSLASQLFSDEMFTSHFIQKCNINGSSNDNDLQVESEIGYFGLLPAEIEAKEAAFASASASASAAGVSTRTKFGRLKVPQSGDTIRKEFFDALLS